MEMKIDAIMIKENDNVATALRDIGPKEVVIIGVGDETRKISIQESIPFGHKFAVDDITSGDEIVKYGEVMGRAVSHIPPGTHAHIQNIESLRGRGDLE